MGSMWCSDIAVLCVVFKSGTQIHSFSSNRYLFCGENTQNIFFWLYEMEHIFLLEENTENDKLPPFAVRTFLRQPAMYRHWRKQRGENRKWKGIERERGTGLSAPCYRCRGTGLRGLCQLLRGPKAPENKHGTLLYLEQCTFSSWRQESNDRVMPIFSL